MTLCRLCIDLPDGLDFVQAGGFCDLLQEGTLSASCHGSEIKKTWRVELLFDAEPDLHDMAARLALAESVTGIALPRQDLKTEIVADKNWLAESYRAFPAFAVGPFFIHGSHEKGPFPEDKIVLQIDAATAFGSGEHGTTKGCMLALAGFKEQGFAPRTILDLGTGSGILAIAAEKLWPGAEVIASDNDAEAVRVALHHASVNGAKIIGVVSEGFADEKLRGVYDLVIANILAGPLMDMAADIARAGRQIILSGIMNEQADNVISAYAAQGAKLGKRTEIGDWTTLDFRGAKP